MPGFPEGASYVRLGRREALRLMLSAVASVATLPFYARWIEPGWVEVVHVRIPLPGLPRNFHGFRLVHLSDLHFDGVWGARRRLPRWLDLVEGLRPHAIVITGDWVTGLEGLPEMEAALPWLRRLRAPEGVFTVLGNHDYWADASGVRRLLALAGIRELRNQVHVWERGRSRLALAGVDDAWSGNPDWQAVREAVPPGVPAILLVHEPDFADHVATLEVFGLQLSGHSHGGQVKLPGWGPPFLPRFGQKYPEGLYHIGGLILYTNRGLGVVPPRIRLLCRPEMTLVELVRQA